MDDEQWTCGPERGEPLKAFVTKQLVTHIGEEKSKQVVRGFAVCPAIDSDGKQAFGWWTLSAVREFFPSISVERKECHGFVAAPGMEAVFFTWKTGMGYEYDEVPPEVYGWTSCDQRLPQQEDVGTMDLGSWWFVFREDEWKIKVRTPRSSVASEGGTDGSL